MAVDPNTPCIVGVGRQTWRPADVGAAGAPEPLLMWEEAVDAALSDCACGTDLLGRIQSLDVVYCQTTQYDDPPGRLAEALGIEPQRAHYSGIGGATPPQPLNGGGARALAGEVARGGGGGGGGECQGRGARRLWGRARGRCGRGPGPGGWGVCPPIPE